MGIPIGACPVGRPRVLHEPPTFAAVRQKSSFALAWRQLKRDRAALVDWIAFYKEWRHVLHGGTTWLGEGADGLVWQAVGSAEEFLLFAIRAAPPLDRRPQPLQLSFAADSAFIDLKLLRIGGGERGHPAASASLFDEMHHAAQRFTGSWLAHAGLPIPPLKAESVAVFYGKAA